MRVPGMKATATAEEPTTVIAADSFEGFYRGQVDIVYRALALVLADAALAREATDEAMLRAYTRWHVVGTHNNPGGWVYRVGLNWATSRWRQTRRERPLPEADRAGMRGSLSPPDPVGIAALAALGRLDVKHRAVVVARVLLNLNTTETAAALGIAAGTVKSRLSRALLHLRTELTIGDTDANR